MMGKTHYTFAAAATLTLAHYQLLSAEMLLPATLSAMIGALLPDLDSPNSSFGRYIPIGSWLFQNILGHRTVTHSLFALVFLHFMLMLFIPAAWAIPIRFGVLIGYASHLIGDMIVGGGIALFWPIRKKIAINPFPLKVGGAGEYLIFVGLFSWSLYLSFLTLFA